MTTDICGVKRREFCDHVNEIIKFERGVIEHHIENHKRFRHIEDTNQAIINFLSEYGWVIQKVYCSLVCEVREQCSCYTDLRFKCLPDISDGEMGEILKMVDRGADLEKLKAEVLILRNHLAEHKWFRGVPGYREAIIDFLDNFGWVLKEVDDISD